MLDHECLTEEAAIAHHKDGTLLIVSFAIIGCKKCEELCKRILATSR